MNQKESHLRRLISAIGVSRLADLTPEKVGQYMRALCDAGRSARTANLARESAVSFLSWCVKVGRIGSNPLLAVSPLAQGRDRRRVRRALTDDELAGLLAVAQDRGREAWYMAAALAGLRRGDLIRLKWSDIDFAEQTITIRDGKAKRADVVPLHSQLAEILARRKVEACALPTARVFPRAVMSSTVQKDFLRAGLARREVVTGASGNPIMNGNGKNRRPKTRITTADLEGRVIDLHAMRTTLGTNLARAGVVPQVAQRIMRHADYRTTLRHYTVLGLVDAADALSRIPNIDSPTEDREGANGTYDDQPCGGKSQQKHHQQYPQQLKRFSQRLGANQCDDGEEAGAGGRVAQPIAVAGHSDELRRGASPRHQYPQGDSNPCLQDENLIS